MPIKVSFSFSANDELFGTLAFVSITSWHISFVPPLGTNRKKTKNTNKNE